MGIVRICHSYGRFASVVTAACFFALAAPVLAVYPEKPITLVVGFPPGGGGDLYGRTLAHELSTQIGQPVIVDNKGGAGGSIAADAVAHAKPDGYTLILAQSGSMCASPALRSDLRYKVPGDFVPISLLVENPFGLMVSSKSKIKTLQEYLSAARAGKLTYASTGTGGASNIVMEMVKQQAKLDILHVAYKGSGPAVTDLIGGQVDSFFAPYTPLMGLIAGGKIRLLAVSSSERVPSLPAIPTLKEAGVDVVMTNWYGLAAPAGTPTGVVETLARHVKAALMQPSVLRVYQADGSHESALSGDAFRDFMARDIAKYKRAVETGNLKPE